MITILKNAFVALILSLGFLPVTAQSNTDSLVSISTPEGEILVKLYEDTPLHRSNFLKLAGEGFFDSTLFHRVIAGFMIQGGDPDSKKAPLGMELGNGGPGYDLPAEITPAHFHKRGVLAAAREDDKINPDRLSSGSQFYIVHGKVFTNDELDKIEQEQNSLIKQQIFVSIMDKPENLKLRNQFFSQDAKKDTTHFRFLLDTLNQLIDIEYQKIPHFTISEARREVYTTLGGAPHLDGRYTIFGEVVEGMDVVDAIANSKTDNNDRPLSDIPMIVKIVTHKRTEQ